jgi:hypothetical protein
MKREPNFGRNGILNLNWVLGESFPKRDVWERIFKPYGVPCRPVLNKRGEELSTVVQLAPDERTVEMDTTGLVQTRCPRCRSVRFKWVVRGPSPALREAPDRDLVRVSQTFGTGMTFRPIVISNRLANDLLREGVRGVELKPLKPIVRS